MLLLESTTMLMAMGSFSVSKKEIFCLRPSSNKAKSSAVSPEISWSCLSVTRTFTEMRSTFTRMAGVLFSFCGLAEQAKRSESRHATATRGIAGESISRVQKPAAGVRCGHESREVEVEKQLDGGGDVTPTAPGQPHGNKKSEDPEEKNRAVLCEEENNGEESVGEVAIAVDRGIMDQRGDGRSRGIELGFVLLREFEVDGGKIDAMLEVFLFGFHLFDFAADAGDFLFDFEDVADFAGALREDGLETLLGFA